MNPVPEEWPALIQSVLDEASGENEHDAGTRTAQLNALLRSDAAARDLFLQMADIHSCLAVDELLWVGDIGTVAIPAMAGPLDTTVRTNSRPTPNPHPIANRDTGTKSNKKENNDAPSSDVSHRISNGARRERWLTWRPLAAAAAGLVFGMGCTTVVFAYSQPKTPPPAIAGTPATPGISTLPASHTLPLTDSDFESPQSIPAEGIPSRPAVWSGDFSRTVEAENGIIPRHGVRMLRFLRSDHNHSSPRERSFVGEVAQVIDLRPLRAGLGKTEYLLEMSAHFNAIAQAPAGRYEFAVKAAAFRGDPADAPRFWEEPESSQSRSHRCVTADSDAATWQRLALPLMVPADADFLVLECAAVWKGPQTGESAVGFPGHYVDRVEVRLGPPPRSQD